MTSSHLSLIATIMICAVSFVVGYQAAEDRRSLVTTLDIDSLPDASGSMHSIVANDSTTLILFVDTRCSACRLGVPEYRGLAARARGDGLAVRVLLPNGPAAVAQFGRLLGTEDALLIDVEAQLFMQFDVTTVPALAAVDTQGQVLARWIPWEPYGEGGAEM
jgi:hypothetical protein